MRINNKKGFTVVLTIICLLTLMLGGCAFGGPDAETAGGETDKSSVCTDGGSVLNIYCWNTEFEERMTAFYPGYTDNGDGTGKIGNVRVVWHITPSDNYGYQNALDEGLLVNMDKAADDRIDLFLLEADYILKYADSDYTLDIINDLGISESELADQYQYTKEIASSRDGKLKGTSWQATPGLFGYRRSIAKDVLGTDDPDEVQKALSDWNGFDEVAQKAASKGYMMLSSTDDCYKIFSNNAKVKWVDDPFSSTPKIQIDDKLWEWAEMCKKYHENGWINDTSQWSEAWNHDQSAEGKVFGFFMSTWGINFTLVGNAGEDGFGDWSVCEGPAAWYWGGTWIAGARGTDNASLVADIMRKLTCDKQIMVKITEETQDYTNTVSGMESIANSDYHSDFLNGQNHIKLFSQAAPKIDMSMAGPYDQGLGDTFREAFKPYINGECDKQAALNEFYKQAVVKFPELTFDAVEVK